MTPLTVTQYDALPPVTVTYPDTPWRSEPGKLRLYIDTLRLVRAVKILSSTATKECIAYQLNSDQAQRSLRVLILGYLIGSTAILFGTRSRSADAPKIATRRVPSPFRQLDGISRTKSCPAIFL